MQNWQIPHRISQLSNAVQVQGRGNRESPRNPHQYPGFSFRFLHLLPEVQDGIEALLKGLGFPLNFLLGKKKESLVMKSVAVCVPNRCRHSSAVYPSIPHFPPCHMLYHISLYAAYPSFCLYVAIAVRSSLVFSSNYCWWGFMFCVFLPISDIPFKLRHFFVHARRRSSNIVCSSCFRVAYRRARRTKNSQSVITPIFPDKKSGKHI